MHFRFITTLLLFQIFGIVPAYACVSNGYSHYETTRFNQRNNSKTSEKGISSPVLRGALSTGVSGGLVGGLTGGVGAALSGGDFFTGMGQGAIYGIGTGLTTGAYGGYQAARAMERDPWTGKIDGLYPSMSLSEVNPKDFKNNFSQGRPTERFIALSQKEAYMNIENFGKTQLDYSSGTTTYPNGNMIRWIKINGTAYYFRSFGDHGSTFHIQLYNDLQTWKYRTKN